MPRPRLHPLPLAFGFDGSLIVNVAAGTTPNDLDALVRTAAETKQVLFVGIVLRGSERRKVLRRLDNASAEAQALVFGPAPAKNGKAAGERPASAAKAKAKSRRKTP